MVWRSSVGRLLGSDPDDEAAVVVTHVRKQNSFDFTAFVLRYAHAAVRVVLACQRRPSDRCSC